MLSTEYLANRALQQAGFSESRILLALRALLGPDPDAPHEDDFEVLDPTLDPDGFQLDPEFDPAHVPGEEPIEPLADDWEPYEPRPEDLEELFRWSEGLDRDYVEAMERADVLEAIDRERWEPDSRIAAGAVD
jgi:hypothetical protein